MLSLHTHTVKNINFFWFFFSSQFLASICSQVELVLLQHTLWILLLTNVCMISYPFSLFMLLYACCFLFCVSCIWGVEFCCNSKPILPKVVTLFQKHHAFMFLAFVCHFEVLRLYCGVLWSIFLELGLWPFFGIGLK